MPLLRSASTALKAALAAKLPLHKADLFAFTLVDGVTILRWTSWDSDLAYNGHSYSSRAPWLTRSKWNVVNTMQVPQLVVKLAALNGDFNGGGNIKTQIHNGLFDGATFLLTTVFMPFDAPGDTTSLGGVDLFGGEVAGIELVSNGATITIKGKVNRLGQYIPRNVYQANCNHAFCDVGCTLNRLTFTASYIAGSAPTTIFIPWNGAAPANYANYQNGTLAMTSGAAAGARRTIVAADATGLTLAYPLYAQPLAGDAFTAFEGCDKTFNSGSGQSCTARSNTQHYRAFDFIPPPNSAV